MHDDLSSICRVYDTLRDTIEYGVKEDTHPAGVQVLLWFWSQIGGTGQTWMRIPFVLMGICSIPLMYLLAKQWYNKNAGLAAASIIAVSQYTIFHSVSVRPYIVGLFLMLILLLSWTAIVLRNDKRHLHYIVFVLTAAGCAYTHAFAALTAALTAIAGLILCHRENRLKLFISSIIAVALFVPHLPITFHQLFDMKGIGEWLGKPTPIFIIRYICYLFHYSYLAIFIGIVAFLLCARWQKQPLKQITAATLWLLPLLIGYCYSVWVNPVLRYSCLIFSFPFLLLTIVSLIPENAGSRGIVALSIYCLSMTATLYASRKHYTFFHNQVYQNACDKARDVQQRLGNENVALYLDIPTHYAAYYGIANTHSDTTSSPYLLTAKVDYETMERLRQSFSVVLEHYDCAEGEIFLLARNGNNQWNREQYYNKSGDIDFDPAKEYTPIFDSNYMAHTRFTDIDITVDDSCMIVMEILLGKQQKAWRSGIGHIHYQMTDIIKNSLLCRFYHVKVYVWNPDHSVFNPQHYSISLQANNPWIYAITEPTW